MANQKSKKSAVILSTIIVISFTLTTAITDILIPYLSNGNISSIVADPQRLAKPENWIGLGAFVMVILLILIAIGAFWLYRFFGERHYGTRGAIRWALFGITFALLMQAFDLVFQGNFALIRGILQFLSIFGAYFLTRLIIPMNIDTG